MAKFIAYDLGTGGVKASLYDERLQTIQKSFIPYDTYYPGPGMHEQKPEDWWNGVIRSTRFLLDQSGISPEDIQCVALSGHSLVALPVDKNLHVLQERVPIWSDTRAESEAKQFFQRVDEEHWYMTTGNGFPAPCYSLFKLMWLKNQDPVLYQKIYKVMGSKDYINFKLTGQVYTDYSYASGSGAYDLIHSRMRNDFIEEAGLSPDIFPEIVPSHQIIGRITREAAEQTGLREGTLVACGGVDNACMALGAVGAAEGAIYISLGSSSWIPVNSRKPIVDAKKRPYVFAHIEKEMFTSAFSIFSAGSSLRWVRDTICHDIADDPAVYQIMDEMAAKAPIGSNGIFFNPSLAGGTSQDKSVNIRGAYLGLHLGITREDMIRAAMEGIALNLRLALDSLKAYAPVSHQIRFCGGGSKSSFWMQMFADVFDMEIIKTNIDQDAASLGAAAIAARATGIWRDYSLIESLHRVERRSTPNPEAVAKYERLLPVFEHACQVLADLGDYMKAEMQLK